MFPLSCSIDFETRSTVDLKVAGLDNYARHPSTEPLCMSYRFGKGPVKRWMKGDAPPADLILHIAAGGIVNAWNAPFEIAIWTHICEPRMGWGPLPIEQCRCTMARSYAMAMPGALANAAPAAGIAEAKDAAGGRLMLQMSKPRTEDPLTWWEDAERMEMLGRYCDQDVITESAMCDRLMPLSADEQSLWQLDFAINQRGVQIDLPSVDAALKIVEAEKARLDKEMRDVTGNFVSVCSEVKRIGDWLRLQGVDLPGLAKADVLDALSLDTLPENCRRALRLRQEAGKTSTAKLKAMREAASSHDGRVRGSMQYHGAGTGRWAGRRIQPQNLPRPNLKQKDIEDAISQFGAKDATEYLEVFHGEPLTVVSSCLRSLICAAPGASLLAADFANIEGRGLAWLAGDEAELIRYRKFDAGTGPDIYKATAAAILGKPIESITDAERQTYGKVPSLACGYQGGVGAFQTMARTYGVKVSDEVADRAKTGWRDAHPRIVGYWYALEEAATNAVLHAGSKYSAGAKGRETTFKVSGSFLWCKLPSGRVLCYPYPTVKAIETPWGEMKDQVHYMTVDGLSNKWVETHTYGGKLAENVTQAICRDLLVAAIRQAESCGYPVVLHVHDEVVSEVPKGFGSLEEFEHACSMMPKWADGLPVVAKGWTGSRYRK